MIMRLLLKPHSNKEVTEWQQVYNDYLESRVIKRGTTILNQWWWACPTLRQAIQARDSIQNANRKMDLSIHKINKIPS